MCISFVVCYHHAFFSSFSSPTSKDPAQRYSYTIISPTPPSSARLSRLPIVPHRWRKNKMASLYTPTLTYDPVTDPRGTKATHYQLERSPGDGFIYEAMADPLTGTATPFYHSDSLIIATAGKGNASFCVDTSSTGAHRSGGGARRAGTRGRFGKSHSCLFIA